MDGSLGREMADLAAWSRLAPLLTEYLPNTGRELRPAALTTLMDEILLGARTVLVECGCGSYSVLLARLLARRGFGRLLCIEHDERLAAFVSSQIRREGLTEVVKVVHAPLAAHPAAVGSLTWYSPSLVYDEVASYVDRFGLIDLLLVDGPSSVDPGTELARYPALPVLRGALAPTAVVLVDDVDRPGELTVLTRWQQEFGLRFRTNTHTRMATAALDPTTCPQ